MNDELLRETPDGAFSDNNTDTENTGLSSTEGNIAENDTAGSSTDVNSTAPNSIPPYQPMNNTPSDTPAEENDSVFAEKDFRTAEDKAFASGYSTDTYSTYGHPAQNTGGQMYGQAPQNYGGQGMNPGYNATNGAYQGYSAQNIPPQAAYSAPGYNSPQYSAPQYNTQNTPPQYNSVQGAPRYAPRYNIPPYGYQEPSPLMPSVSEPAQKKNTSTVVMVVMAVIVVLLLAVVMIILAVKAKDNVGSAFEPSSSGSVSQNVTVNIEMDKRPAEDKSDYADEEKGLFTIQGAVKYALPSVVSLYGYKEGTPAPVTSASGTILSKDGYIITNAHVVDDIDSLGVTLSDGTKYKAKVVAFDNRTDVAVIKIDADDLTPAVIGSADDLEQGDTVITIGNTGYDISCIQTDAALNHGQSGGAVIDLYGRVVGIVVSKFYSSETENLGFAIRSDEFVPVCEELIKKGYVSGRPRMGIIYTFINADYAAKNALRTGVYVTEISPDCNIAKSGLQVGDIITKVGDIDMNVEGDVKKIQSVYKPGDTVKAKVFRKDQFSNDDGEEIEIEFTFDEFTE